jgi:hypothetical protein
MDQSNWRGATGRPGGRGALWFDSAAPGDYVDIGTPADITALTEALTLTAWIRPADTSRGDFIAQWGTGQRHFALVYAFSGTAARFYVSTTGSNLYSSGDSAGLTAGTWWFVCGVFDKVNVSVWVNGVRESYTALSTSLYGSSTTPVTIGKSSLDAYKGHIDDVRVYNRALSPIELYTLYRESRGGYPRMFAYPRKRTAAGLSAGILSTPWYFRQYVTNRRIA